MEVEIIFGLNLGVVIFSIFLERLLELGGEINWWV